MGSPSSSEATVGHIYLASEEVHTTSCTYNHNFISQNKKLKKEYIDYYNTHNTYKYGGLSKTYRKV